MVGDFWESKIYIYQWWSLRMLIFVDYNINRMSPCIPQNDDKWQNTYAFPVTPGRAYSGLCSSFLRFLPSVTWGVWYPQGGNTNWTFFLSFFHARVSVRTKQALSARALTTPLTHLPTRGPPPLLLPSSLLCSPALPHQWRWCNISITSTQASSTKMATN